MPPVALQTMAPLLRRVEKPGRYVGGEFGASVRTDASLRVVLSYPDLYEIGMSNAAVRILYGLLNKVPGVACERVFAPAPDFEKELRAARLPLTSLESRTPVSEFDVVGFSFGYELTLTNVLAILEVGGVSLLAAARGPREPLVVVGGPAATNPAPLAPFVDAVFIGEAEAWAETTFARLAEIRRAGGTRQDLLDVLREDPSIWFPGKGDVRRAFWRGFAEAPADARYPVPNLRIVQDHGTVEIMRGCPNACRFCHATVLYRPARLKSAAAVAVEVRGLVEEAGYRQVTLSSLSSGDFRGIHELVRSLNTTYASRKVSFSLPSLRVDSLSLGLFTEISEVRKSGLTFAVETPRPEWQAAVRKTVTLEKTIALLREARARGWKSAKFYFMVGLPPSLDQDESGPIVEFLRAVRAATGMSLNVNVASFIPKPHTPWERAAQLEAQPARERIMAVRDGLKGDGFKIGYHEPFFSVLEGLVARGDERAGLLVLDAYRRGARLDAWEEHIRPDLWREAIAAASWDVVGETCRPRAPEERLPWAGIQLGLSRSVVAGGTSPAAPGQAARPQGVAEVSREPGTGQGPKAPVTPQAPIPWQRLVFSFRKVGPAAFLSHLDLMTTMERALARTGWHVRFTEGYNPKPRLEFASPLSLGVESEEEVAAVDVEGLGAKDPQELVGALTMALPEGMDALRAAFAVVVPGARRRSLMSLSWGSDYEVHDAGGAKRLLRLPATGPSLRKILEAEGAWMTVTARRIASLARGNAGAPVSYFEALCSPSAPPETPSRPAAASAS